MSSETNCPLCGATVKQVASATLDLALWQHLNWVCTQKEREVKENGSFEQ